MAQLVSTPLWQHQIETVERFSDTNQRRVLCAWGMGSGKTLFALETDARLRATVKTKSGTFKTLVVAPTQTHRGWIETIKRELPGIPVARLDGRNAKTRAQFFTDHVLGWGLSSTKSGIWVMHWDALRILQEELRAFGFHHLILDECHRIKNRNTARTKAAKALGIPFATDMSGSPLPNKPQDLWSIGNHLFPKDKYYGSYWRFVNAYLEVDRSSGYMVIGGPKLRWFEEGLPNLQPFYSRVETEDCIDLPKLHRVQIQVDLGEYQRSQYDQMEKEWLAWVEDFDGELTPMTASIVVAKLRRLQQFAISSMRYSGTKTATKKKRNPLTNEIEKYKVEVPVYDAVMPSAKVDCLVDIIDDNDSQNFVLFSQFTGPLTLLASQLNNKKNPKRCVLYTGLQDTIEREKNLDLFLKGDSQVICFTYGTGGEGLDGLQKVCRNLILVDRDWSPGVNDQAIARLWRAGADTRQSIVVADLVADNTVDDKRIEDILTKKINVDMMMGKFGEYLED